MSFSQSLWFISHQIFDVKKGKIKGRKNKRATPNFAPFEQKDLGGELTLTEGDIIFILPRTLLEEYDKKLILYKKV